MTSHKLIQAIHSQYVFTAWKRTAHTLFAETKVCDLNIAFCVQEQIIQFKVPEGEEEEEGEEEIRRETRV